MHLTWKRFSYPLSTPLSLSTGLLSAREGLYITLSDQSLVGTGEAAPLPGFSWESLEDIEKQLSRMSDLLSTKSLPSAEAVLKGELRFLNAAPALQFGLESAVLNAQSYHFPQAIPVKVNALLSGPTKTLTPVVQKKLSEGYTCFKLKVGGRQIQEEIIRIHHVLALLPPSCTLRLDANRQWDLASAITIGKAIIHPQLDYIEEPLNAPEKLDRFYQETGLPIAWDESVLTLPHDWEPGIGLKACILKPTLLGLSKSLALANQCIDYGILPVISSCFESRVGLDVLIELAGSLPVDTWHGLEEIV